MTTAYDVDRAALESFVDDNADLERLETMLDRFNIFESLGLVRQETRHSDFLRWLLDPSETHGLGDYWLRRLLRQVIEAGEGIYENSPSVFDLDGWDLGRAEIRREWRNIDLLILDRDNHFVCVVENKIDSDEHSNQLKRYREIVEGEYPEYKKAFVFLTIAGDVPSDDAYIPVSYGDIVGVIEPAPKRQESQINDEIWLFVQQYIDMVRRHIVEDSEIQEICNRLYQNHRRALDLIFEYRPDRATEVAQAIQDYIKSRGDLIPDGSSKSYIKFLPSRMDVLPHDGWQGGSKRMLDFTLENKGKVQFRLEMQPGPEQTRMQIYEKAKELPGVFGKPKKLSPQYHSFFSETWITAGEYNELNSEEIKQRIGDKVQFFLERKGSAIADALKEIKFEAAGE